MSRDHDHDESREGVSRRDLLKQVGRAGVAVAIPLRVVRPDTAERTAAVTTATAAEPFQTVSEGEGKLLAAVVARIIPSDDSGPGAAEARAARYIDRALGGVLSASRQSYVDGLAALDRYTRSSRRMAFTELSSADQDAVLIDVETGSATGFTQPTAPAFFAMVRAHTIQGTFGDPYYGGNANFVGWDLIGYPGLRLAVSADEQRLGAKLAPTHRSAYDHTMFEKATVDAGSVDPSPSACGRRAENTHSREARPPGEARLSCGD
jgi:gluconate 2-dehydrogenase gamma chain